MFRECPSHIVLLTMPAQDISLGYLQGGLYFPEYLSGMKSGIIHAKQVAKDMLQGPVHMAQGHISVGK
jgi:hypothetical protein